MASPPQNRRRPGRAQSGGTAGPLRYPVPVTPEELANAIHAILLAAAGDGALDFLVEQIPVPRVERSRNREHGDWSTNVAMQLAKRAGTRPRDLAELLRDRKSVV